MVDTPSDPNPRQAAEPSLYQHLPPWFVAVVGISYVAGYEIEFLYYASLGIIDAAGEVFKLKYIQTGIGFIFPCGLITIFLLLLIDRSIVNVSILNIASRGFYVTYVSIFAIVFNISSIYIVILFTPLHHFDTWPHWGGIFSLIVLLALYGMSFIVLENRYSDSYRTMQRATSGRLTTKQKRELLSKWLQQIYLQNAAGSLFIVFMAVADYFVLRERKVAMLGLLQRGWIFLLLSLLIPILFRRVVYRLGQARMMRDKQANFRWYIILGTSLVVFGLVLFLVLTSYSYRIFPFVPNLKGGADYENSPRVSVVVKNDESTSDLRNLSGAVLLYTSSESYYFARPKKGNDPCDWRVGRVRPKIIAVRRDEVKALSFTAESEELAGTNCKWEEKAITEGARGDSFDE